MSVHESASRAELEKLRRELGDLRKAAGLPEPVKQEQHPKEVYASTTLIDSMERLHGVLDRLVKLFENANREVYDGYEKGLKDTDAKLEQLIMQNEKIARGVVALADMVKQQRAPPAVRLTPPVPTSFTPSTASPAATANSAVPSTDDAPVPPPPRFEPTAFTQAQWTPQPSNATQPSLDDESFMRAPVTQLNPPAATSVAPPAITRAALPPLASPLPAPLTQANPLPALPSLAPPSGLMDASAKPALGELAPPPPPPPTANRRSILDKFSFK